MKFTNHRKQNDLEQFNNSSNCMYSGLQGKAISGMYKHLETNV